MKTITIDGVEYNLLPKVKFKAGDWVVIDNCHNSIYQVDSVREYDYMLKHTHGGLMPFPFSSAERLRLWSIADAKDGDVLVTEDYIFIFKYILHGGVHLYCHYDIDDEEFDSDIPDAIIGNIHDKGAHFQPITKEQRGLFFTKMREAGYQWNVDKKELHKIHPHYDIANFKPFDKVLVRCSNDEEWMIEFYCKYDTLVHTSPHRDYPFMGIGDSYSQCIPFEGNEHLLGTTDMCAEEYINW